MSIRNVYSVHDKAAQAFATPFFMNNDAHAKRGFVDAVKNDKNLSSYAEDYVLYRVGSFDDVTGNMSCLPSPDKICTGIEAKAILADMLDIEDSTINQ